MVLNSQREGGIIGVIGNGEWLINIGYGRENSG